MFEPLVYAWNHGSFGYLLLLLLVSSTRSHMWFLSLFVRFFFGGGGVLFGWSDGCTTPQNYNYFQWVLWGWESLLFTSNTQLIP
jgi:hypothetical protein